MNKLIYLFLLLFIFNSCSYEPILSKKKYIFCHIDHRLRESSNKEAKETKKNLHQSISLPGLANTETTLQLFNNSTIIFCVHN